MASIRLLKAEKTKVRVTIRRDRLEHKVNVSTTSETLTKVSTQLNSTMSIEEARYVTSDIKKNTTAHQRKNLNMGTCIWS